MRFRSLGQEDPLVEEMATHSSILAWGQRSLAGYSPSGFKESDRTDPQLGTDGPMVKNSPCNAEFVGSIPVRSTCHGPCATMKDPA